MIPPIRGPGAASRPSSAANAYARFSRPAAQRAARLGTDRGAKESLEWRVSELPSGGRTRVRRWTVDAGDGSGERTIHIDAIVE